MTYERLFEIGTMAGLMALFSRHSRLLTNFRIFEAESRPVASGEEQVCGGSSRDPECLRGANMRPEAVVGPWQYQS